MRFREIERALAELGLRPADLAERYLDLPLLFHYGRSDATVAFYGANVAPTDVEEVVYSLPELAERVGSFALLPGEDERANKTLAFAFELAAGAERPADVESTRARFLDRLTEVNQDYREAARFIPQGKEPTIEFHPPGEGPFAGYDIRLKHKYVQSEARADTAAAPRLVAAQLPAEDGG